MAAKDVLKYRLAILNLPVDQELVEEKVKEELGEDAELIDWEEESQSNFEGPVLNAVTNGGMMPQRITIVTLRYRFS